MLNVIDNLNLELGYIFANGHNEQCSLCPLDSDCRESKPRYTSQPL